MRLLVSPVRAAHVTPRLLLFSSCWTISSRLFELAQRLVYPTTGGSSGIFDRYLSRLVLKTSTVVLVIFLIDFGSTFKRRAPCLDVFFGCIFFALPKLRPLCCTISYKIFFLINEIYNSVRYQTL